MTPEETEELTNRVRRLEIKARHLVAESFSGQYQSSLKGRGLDFDDFREYQHGDDPRLIDWSVTARTGHPFIRRFQEERELPVILAVDVSASTLYGSVRNSKRELAAELAAILGFAARRNGDKVGLLLFSTETTHYLPPSKTPGTVLRCVREILTAEPAQNGTSLATASRFLLKTIPRKALVFLISDFIDWGFEKPLASLARRHDLIALHLLDPAERELPAAGTAILRDLETGHLIEINTSNPNVRMAYAKLSRRFREGLRNFFRKHRIDHLPVLTDADYLPALHRLFKNRARRS